MCVSKWFPRICQFLSRKPIPTLYSPDLTLCDIFLFPKLKSLLRETHFQAVDIRKKVAELLKALRQNYFRRCFEAWKVF